MYTYNIIIVRVVILIYRYQPPAVHKILPNYYYGSFDAAAGVNIVRAEGSRTGAADITQAVHVPEHLPLCPLPPGV